MGYKKRLKVMKKRWWARLCLYATLAVTTMLAVTSSAMIEAYRNIVSENVVHVMNSAWVKVYGMFNPLPKEHDYHFSVTFYIPPSGDNTGGSESTGVSISGEECSKSGGITYSTPSSLNFENWQNNIITEAYCSSGKVIVSLIPQTGGEKQVIYDGLFYEGKQITFSGVSGKYNAGVLTLISTDRSEPTGDWVPVNECQESGSCNSQYFN
ncbi:hypothetical protein J7S95_18745 [Providencia stuartii]|uniref:hypothetical protein n=1 Tax=Morganellaceae TaxID=1903414 RepID=UPI000BD5BDE2|nr:MULTISPECIES: hypothetical protein [Providencia]MBQ0458738.1 hypothetical protein [Providencia stuartii]PCQ36721.1 hypothetical protein CQA26_17225 [Providencia rettgeri]